MNIRLTDKFSEYFQFSLAFSSTLHAFERHHRGLCVAVQIENTEKLYFYSRNLRNNIQHIYIFCIFTGKIRAPAQVQQVMACSLPERLLPLIVISMARRQVLAPPNILVIQVPPSIEISMGRLLARARLRVGCQTKVAIIIMDGAVQSQKVNNPKKLLHVAQLLEVSKLLTLQVGCSVFSIQFFSRQLPFLWL